MISVRMSGELTRRVIFSLEWNVGLDKRPCAPWYLDGILVRDRCCLDSVVFQIPVNPDADGIC